MNILFVTAIFAQNEMDTALSGMPYAVYKSAVGMKKIGHEVAILTVSNKDMEWYYKGLKVVSVYARHGLDGGEQTKDILKSLFCILNREYKIQKTIKCLNQKKPIDVIQYAGWFGTGLLHTSKIPGVMRISTYTKVQLAYNYGKKKKYLLELAEYFAAKRMNFIFAPSRIMAEGVERDINRRVCVIETPFLNEKINENFMLMQTKLKGKKYILFFGRMSVDKGILVIKDILYRTLDKYSDIYFAFAGISWMHNGVLIEKELMRQAKKYKKRVIFLGQLSKELLIPVIKNAEMILMPSLADNFPNSCAEAMALGKVVIGTDGSSLEQFIINGENGFLAEKGNPDSLLERLEDVLSMDDKQKEKISNRARERITKLDLKRYSKKMEGLYNKLL